MNPNLSLALAIGGGLIGLVILHAILSGQSAAASAITVGATLTSPFNVMGDTSGSLVNNATVTGPASSSGNGAAAADSGYSGWTTQLYPSPPAGVPSQGWGAAMIGMHDIAAGSSPAIAQGYV